MATRFIRILLPTLAIVGATWWFLYREYERARLVELERTEEKSVALLQESLTDDFRAVITDLLVLSDSSALRRLVEVAGRPDDADSRSGDVTSPRATEQRNLLAEELLRFSLRKQVYDQVRYLDETGWEIVRINRTADGSAVVPLTLLQRKEDRYYFHATSQLRAGELFISPFDLNVEDGRIESPQKPTIRFGTPVFDSRGNRRGILVLNYLGQTMLDRFARLDADSPGQAMLLNSDGYWLYGAKPDELWAFMFPERAAVRFSTRYASTWDRLRQQRSGQFRNADGLFTFGTIYPFREPQSWQPTEPAPVPNFAAPEVSGQGTARGEQHPIAFAGTLHSWKIVSHVSNAEISRFLSELRRSMSALALIMASVVIASSWGIGRVSLAREQSERALRDSESRFRRMADSIREVFWMSDVRREKMLYVSPAFRSIWGGQASSLDEMSRQWRDSIHAEDRETAERVFRVIGQADDFSAEYRICRSDGEVRWIWDHGFAMRDAEGQIVSYAGIAEDVSRLKETQGRLLQSERLAAIGEAITGLAHESRNALQRSQACLEMLTKRISDRPDAADLAARIQVALRDLHALYERVRSYAAPGRMDRQWHDLYQVALRTRDELADLVAERKAAITILRQTPDSTANEDSLALDRPEAARHARTGQAEADAGRWRCLIDEVAIRQVLRNVLENALDQQLDTNPPREAVEVRITLAQTLVGDGIHDSEALVVTVEDNGPGFSGEDLEQIFEPFYTTKTKGTGLGMAICRRVIESHGGQIVARPSSMGGLAVRWWIPRGQR